MEKFLIRKNNKVQDIVNGRPQNVGEGETIEVLTGSFSNVKIGDYYIAGTDTYYHPLVHVLDINPTASSFTDMAHIDGNTYNLSLTYKENISSITEDCISSDDVNISNFATVDNGFNFDIVVKDEITGSGDQVLTINYLPQVSGIKDTNNNPVLTRSIGYDFKLRYTE